MKKQRRLFPGITILVFISLILFNCGPSSSGGDSPGGKSNQARKYNDNLVKYQRPVEKKIYALNAALKRQDPREIQDKLADLQEQIETSADTVSQMPGFEGDTSLRDAFLDELEFYESLWSEEGREMVDRFISDPGAEDLKEFTKKFNDRLNTEGEKVEKKLISTQHSFLKKYKLKQ